MKAWALVIGCYAVLIALVATVIFLHVWQDARLVTAGLLHRDHRIVESDIVYEGWPRRWLLPWASAARDFVGRYATRELPAGTPLTEKDTSANPGLVPPGHRLLYWMPLAATIPAALRRDADVGHFAELCNATTTRKRCTGLQRIAGLSCDARDATSCFVGLWLQPRDRARFLDVTAPTKERGPLQLFVQRPVVK